ncbi:MAG: DUF371 domain-containing protein [Candidatus Bathyarchaeota archaeon]|nr:DUF371 domain-containing protein [Candidatus Bathyarchaeota archaeon]
MKHVTEVVWAQGHPNIQAIHPTTLMLTKDTHLTPTGDCIVAVAAEKAAADLSPQFKQALQSPNAKLTIQIEADDITEQINASGSPKLQLTHPSDLVVRRSSFICNRTLAICADRASNDLPREFVEKLKNPKQRVKVTFVASADF